MAHHKRPSTASSLSSDQRDGPSWWAATPAVSDVVNPAYSLFEFFPRNAEPYAQLRVSLSGGMHAYHDFFTKDALFPLYSSCRKHLPGQIDESSIMRDIIDGRIPGVVRAKCPDSENDGMVIVVESSHLQRPLSLHLAHRESMDSFLERAMRYLQYLNHTLSDLEHETAEKTHQCDELAKTLEESVDKKISFDQQLIQGTTTLMIEKEKHWKA